MLLIGEPAAAEKKDEGKQKHGEVHVLQAEVGPHHVRVGKGRVVRLCSSLWATGTVAVFIPPGLAG